jgi:hypothetical protein
MAHPPQVLLGLRRTTGAERAVGVIGYGAQPLVLCAREVKLLAQP